VRGKERKREILQGSARYTKPVEPHIIIEWSSCGYPTECFINFYEMQLNAVRCPSEANETGVKFSKDHSDCTASIYLLYKH
jgi:hypothetical protein